MTVVATRPRLWLTPTLLATLKARAARQTERWQTLQNCADRASDPRNPAIGANWDVGCLTYALAWVLTGNRVYADRAIGLAQLWVDGGDGSITGDSFLKTREVLHAMAVVWDWCNPVLTPAQKTTWLPQMERWLAMVWPETDPARAGGWGTTNPGSNYYLAFLQSLTLGLSLYGDSPRAPGHIDLGLQKLAAVQAYLNLQGAGGMWWEGSAYGAMSTRFLLFALNAVSTATDVDMLTPFFSAGWGADMAHATIACTTPTLDRLYPSGDNAVGWINDMQRGNMLVAARYGVPGTKEWCDTIKPARVTQRAEAWLEFMFFPEALP